MSWRDTSITRMLGLQYPIVQGPFGGGLSSVALITAVGRAGGLGSYGVHHLAPEKIREVAEDIRRQSPAPFALNLWVSDCDPGAETMSEAARAQGLAMFDAAYRTLGVATPPAYEAPVWTFEEQAAAVIAARPAVFSFVFGIPSPAILEECRRRGIRTCGAATTVDEALALEAAGVDLILATGCEAGGHRPSFLRSAEDSLVGTLALVPQVVARVKAPVIAAGGIADAAGIAAAFALGAQAVQLGTAFLACVESGTSDAHRARLLEGDRSRTVLSKALTGRLARFLPNEFLTQLESSGARPLPFPLQSWFTSPAKRAAMEQNRADYMTLYAGQGAPLLKHRTAAELMAALVQDLDARL